MSPFAKLVISLSLVALAAALGACGSGSSARASDTLALARAESVRAITKARVAAAAESARAVRPPAPPPREPKLSPLADSISKVLVFHAQNLPVLTIASRDSRFLLDIGRVDTKIATPPRQAAFKEAVTALSPLKQGQLLRVHGPWGAIDAKVAGFEAWNSRIAATLDLPAAIDSLAKRKETVVAVATRETAPQPPTTDDCQRTPSAELIARGKMVKDSIVRALRAADTTALPERLAKSRRVQTSVAYGCFTQARTPSAMVLVALVAGNYEYGREAAAIVAENGAVTKVTVADVRFRTHELMHALDADGDGIDDVAARGKGINIGDTVVLHYDPAKQQLVRLTGGFSWETM